MKLSNRAMLWNAWDISTALFPVLGLFWQNNRAPALENFPSKPLEIAISESLNFKMYLDD